MKRIGLLSDTHHYLDENIFLHFKECDEIWHAGDFGTIEIAEKIKHHPGLSHHPIFKGVYGNIDSSDIRSEYPEQLIFNCEDVKVMIKHIGGYPGRYAPGVKNTIQQEKIKLFISGHSHILKIIYDEKLDCLHMNPGAAGNQGWHLVRTIIRFSIDGKNIKDCEVIELGKKNF
ncbi:MAG: metallophosphoesterase family protein [Bacteroidetes bacterium]|nr:metallophosphoesterase family protein [Bacteroidota bacterium]